MFHLTGTISNIDGSDKQRGHGRKKNMKIIIPMRIIGVFLNY